MAFERGGNDGLFTCDTCGEEREVSDVRHDGAFQRAVAEMKDEGWSIFVDKGVWKHKCPGCASGANSVKRFFE